MAITKGDVKLIKSETMLDTPDGGGRMAKASTNEIVDGVSNAIFPDISELDRAYGRIALRKVFASVLTSDTSSYYGAHALITEVPKDPRVSTVLFSTRSGSDTREAARNRIEQYLAPSARWQGHLLEVQLEGARAIQILMKPGDPLPEVGRTLYLVQDEGLAGMVYQYVRVTKVTSLERKYTHQSGKEWTGLLATITISDPLRYTFEGIAPTPYEWEMSQARAKPRDTIVADAAKYYGTAKAINQADLGDFSIQVDTIYGQLVPSAQTEVALADLDAGGQSQPVIQSGDNPVAYTITQAFGEGKSLYLGTGCTPGTLTITNGANILTDSAGRLMASGTAVGTIDYSTGFLLFSTGNWTGVSNIEFTPAASPVRVVQSAALKCGQNDRGYIWTINLNPPPPPKSLICSFRAQGKWYDLRDQGAVANAGVGQVAGADASLGSGTINYVTGSVVLTLGALPDADSELLFFWSTASNCFNRSSRPVERPYFKIALQNTGLIPGQVTLTWPNPGGAGTLSVTDDGHGKFNNAHATGTIRYQTGEIIFRPMVILMDNSTLTVDYAHGTKDQVEFSHPQRNNDGRLEITIPGGNLIPGTLEVEWNTLYHHFDETSKEPLGLQLMSASVQPTTQPRDPIMIQMDNPTTAKFKDWTPYNVIDYVTGIIEFNPDGTAKVPSPQYESTYLGQQQKDVLFQTSTMRWSGAQWVQNTNPQNQQRAVVAGDPVYRNALKGITYKDVAVLFPSDETGWVKVRFLQTQSANVVQEQITFSEMYVDLTDQYSEKLVTGSARFQFGTKTYVDRVGQLYTDIDQSSGNGTLAGTINYATGGVKLTIFPSGATNQLTMQSLLTEQGNEPAEYVVFRVPSSPVRSGSFQMRGTRVDGSTFNVTAQTNGKIIGPDIVGNIDYLTGIVEVRFASVTDGTHLQDARYYDPLDPANADGMVMIPSPVWLDTLRYNAVAYSYLPLDATLLGLDPVRLPPDGKVPIFKTGDVAVIHNTIKTPVPNNPAGGLEIDVGRVRVTYLKLVDSTGVALPESEYTTNPDAGTLKLSDSFTTGAYVQPLYVEHRIEDMALISDVQLNGLLTFTRPLTHDFPVLNTKVSSALIIGDMQASVNRNVFFTQLSWTGEWKDSRIGSSTTSQYNIALSPILLSNMGAIAERWVVIFDSSSNFRVVGETVGQIATGNITTACAPLNPATNAPYFQINPEGWGTGWAAGNVVRFNTYAANFPLWIARTVLQGPATVFDANGDGIDDADGFQLQIRGDIDRV